MIEITKYHLDVMRLATQTLSSIANNRPDEDVSFNVELLTRPCCICASAFEWYKDNDHESGIKGAEHVVWYLETDAERSEKERLSFIAKIAEWEVKYGLL
jgi:hypothetical protein